MTVNYDELAKQMITLIGGKDNISSAYHCITRLRFILKDKSLVKTEEIQKLSGTLGTQWTGDQFQIIIGQNVDKAYKAICKTAGIEEEKVINEQLDEIQNKKKFKVTDIFQTLGAILLPVIPALAGAGMIKGIITIMTSYLGFDAASPLIQVMTISGDCAFYFLPFLVAWSASKQFKTNTALAIALAGVLLYPTMTAGNTAGATPLSLFGLPIPFPRYFGSTIPIILTVFILQFVYKGIDKIMPKSIKFVFTPMVVLMIMTPLTLIVIGPLANYISKTLVFVVKSLYDISPLITGLVVGATRLFVVMSGMHLSLGTIAIENLGQFGYDYLLPMNTMGTMALFGTCLGVWIRAKNTENKSVGLSTTISSFIGITEPGIYGVFLKFKNAMIASVIGGAAGGAIVGMFGGRATAYVNSCILSIPVFMTDGFWAVCVGMLVATLVSFGVVLVLGIKEDQEVI